MINLKSKNIIIAIFKIFLIVIVVHSIQSKINPGNQPLTTDELTSVGINSFYVLINGQIHTQPFKVVLLSTLVFSYYMLSMAQINNFYEGLKETIRIRSKNLYDYFYKSIQFLLKPILTDVLISLLTIITTILLIHTDHSLSLTAIKYLLLTGIFYSVLPFLLLFIVNRIEFFLVGVFTLSIFADYFVYKLPVAGVLVLYLLILTVLYGIILFKERRA